MNRTFYKICLGGYLAVLFYLVFFLSSRHEIVKYNLVPFKTIHWYLVRFELFKPQIPTDSGIEAQIYGNVLVFIPLGFLLPLVFRKMSSPSRVILIAALFSTCIEIVQRVFRVGEFDVDDIILNTGGGIGGFILFAFYNWFTQTRVEENRRHPENYRS